MWEGCVLILLLMNLINFDKSANLMMPVNIFDKNTLFVRNASLKSKPYLFVMQQVWIFVTFADDIIPGGPKRIKGVLGTSPNPEPFVRPQ